MSNIYFFYGRDNLVRWIFPPRGKPPRADWLLESCRESTNYKGCLRIDAGAAHPIHNLFPKRDPDYNPYNKRALAGLLRLLHQYSFSVSSSPIFSLQQSISQVPPTFSSRLEGQSIHIAWPVTVLSSSFCLPVLPWYAFGIIPIKLLKSLLFSSSFQLGWPPVMTSTLGITRLWRLHRPPISLQSQKNEGWIGQWVLME